MIEAFSRTVAPCCTLFGSLLYQVAALQNGHWVYGVYGLPTSCSLLELHRRRRSSMPVSPGIGGYCAKRMSKNRDGQHLTSANPRSTADVSSPMISFPGKSRVRQFGSENMGYWTSSWIISGLLWRFSAVPQASHTQWLVKNGISTSWTRIIPIVTIVFNPTRASCSLSPKSTHANKIHRSQEIFSELDSLSQGG